MKIYKVILLSMLVLLAGCVAGEPGDHVDDFEAAWERIRNVYPFFDLKGIHWDALYPDYRRRAEEVAGNDFYDVLYDLLAELKDGHVYYLTGGGDQVIPYIPPRAEKDRKAFSLTVVQSYFSEDLLKTQKESILYGKLSGNTGYIYLANLNEDEVAKKFPDILNCLKDTSGLIIDLRTNQGGSLQNVEAVVSRFISEPMPWPELYILEELYSLPAMEPAGTVPYTAPMVVLISGVTFSAGESAAEILRQLANVTLVGEPTGGGGGVGSGNSTETVSKFRLPSGIYINIPTGYFLKYDGTHYEWLGVSPDIRVEQTEADIKDGRDNQLEFAMGLLNR